LQFQPSLDDVPLALVAILEYLYQKNAKSEEGIFRLTGSRQRVEEIIVKMEDAGSNLLQKDVLYDELDPHNISSLLKRYLNDLPEPIIPIDNFHNLLDAHKTKDIEVKKSQFSKHVATMPVKNRSCLKHILYYAKVVADNGDVNKMKLSNVASVLAPTIMRTQDSRDFMLSFGPAGGCLVFMLQNYEEVFGVYQPLESFRPFLDGDGLETGRMSMDLMSPAFFK